MSIIPKLEDCLNDINPDYDPSKPMKSIDVERMEKVDYDLPVDVEENIGYWKGITMQGEPFDIKTKSLKIHECKECAKNWHKITSEQNFFPVDGSYCRVRREELHLIVTKAVIEPYNTKGITLPRIEKEHMLLFFIDKAILSEQALKKVVTKLTSEDLKGEGPIYILWRPEFRAVDQSTGLTTRLRTLTELQALDGITETEKETGLVLIDGLLYPPAVFVDEVLDKYKKLDEKGYKICSLVKRPGTPKFVPYLRERKILDVDIDRYASDLPFLRGTLKPLHFTHWISYKPYGKRWEVPDEWDVLFSYIMTSNASIFRVEMPMKYVDEWIEIVKLLISLSEANLGDLPAPLSITDRLCKFSRGERIRFGSALDEIFARKNVMLVRPYGEVF